MLESASNSCRKTRSCRGSSQQRERETQRLFHAACAPAQVCCLLLLSGTEASQMVCSTRHRLTQQHFLQCAPALVELCRGPKEHAGKHTACMGARDVSVWYMNAVCRLTTCWWLPWEQHTRLEELHRSKSAPCCLVHRQQRAWGACTPSEWFAEANKTCKPTCHPRQQNASLVLWYRDAFSRVHSD